MRSSLAAFLALACALAAATVLVALEGQDEARAGGAARPLRGLPAWTAGFASWTKLNRKPIPPRTNDAHRGTKNVYASRRPNARGVYPYGTVIVKTIRRPGSRFVGVVAAMRKVRGANPRHNDWVFVEWERPRKGARFSVLARGELCTSCHMGAARDDYVWIETLGLAR